MPYKIKQGSNARNILLLNKITISTVVIAMTIATTVVAGEAGEEDVLSFYEQSVEIRAEDNDAWMLRSMANRAGITSSSCQTKWRVLTVWVHKWKC